MMWRAEGAIEFFRASIWWASDVISEANQQVVVDSSGHCASAGLTADTVPRE